MLRRLIITLLLHTCTCQEIEHKRRDASLRGPKIQTAAQTRAYDPLRTSKTNGRQELASLQDELTSTTKNDDTREPYDPLHVLTRESQDPLDLDMQRALQSKKRKARSLATHPRRIPYRLFRPSTISLNYILSSKALRKECQLVTLELVWETPNQSSQTSWMITLGSLSDVQSVNLPNYIQSEGNSGEGTIVAYSHRQYYQQYLERHALCLPGKGLYTFTIFDWNGDGLQQGNTNEGQYTLYSLDRRPIIQGGNFKYMDSKEFVLPLEGLGTARPSASPAPSSSGMPSRDCDWIEIDILYDMYPEETTWMVIAGDYSSLDNGNITIIEESTVDSGLGEGFTVNVGAAGGSSMTRRVCLPGEGRYSFVIFDSYYNGICCEFGDGSYTITTPALPGEILGQGGEFTTFDIVTFDVPFVRAPTTTPSSSPYPTVSHAPTVDCKYVELEVKFDQYASENSWSITKNNDGKEVVVAESPFYSDPDYGGVYTILTICLPGDGVYTFTMEDKAGDGICCLYGDGFYSLTYKGEGRETLTIVEGAEFSYEESTTFTVPYGSTTMAPTMTPAPSTKCYTVEVSVTFDKYPYETIWLIAEGGLDGSSLNDDNTFATVVESPKYNLGNINTTDVHVECLPEGTYSFLIVDSDGICCAFGNGEYTITVANGNGRKVVIKQGGEFTSLESVTFDLPFVLGSSPTMPPVPNGQAPTSSGETSLFWVDIDLKFDSAPYEISWVVTDDQANVIEESPYYTMFYEDGSESHRVYLPYAGDYSFTIFDKGGNGLCCTSGSGNFQVTSHDPLGDVVISQGSDFGSEENVMFTVQTNQDGTSMWPTPLQGWVASMWPTPMPSPPPERDTASPTVTDCTKVNIELMFDVFPFDTHWWLVEGDLNEFESKQPKFIGKSPTPFYDVERFSNATHSFCLGEGQYTFMIFDDGGNGMCCKSGDGSYSLSHGENNENVFASGGKFDFFDTVLFEVPFLTRSPSWTPVPTTSTPTSYSPTFDTPAPSIGGSNLDCEILLHLTTDTDGEQSEIRWEVALGDQSSVSNEFALIVAQSEQATYSISSVSERTVDSDKVCLPGEGQYTFTIFDNNSGGDTRYRLVVDGTLVAYGSGFSFQESTTFSVPVTGQPTPSPQVNDSPSSADCTMINISITFDDFPDETYWTVYEGNADGLADAVIVANSPYYQNMTANSTNHQVCLPGDGEYTFVMYDVASDGMCCNFGKGGYVVSSVDEPIIVAEGGQFEEADISTFSVPIMIAPSTAPSITPKPTESSPPTIPCSAVELSVTFDAFSMETAWKLFDADNNTIAESPFYPNTDFANETINENFCLPDGSYVFLLTDQAGDGNCCVGLGDGSYSIVYHDGSSDVIIVDKGPDPSFVYYDTTEFTIPYVIPPSKSPTISPAPTESMGPTASCIQMEVVINFDAYPADTLWEITVGDTTTWDNTSAVIAADSPIYSSIDMYSTVTHSICLPGDETYTFTVFDGTGNGMCCDEGTGGFIVLMIDSDGEREIIAEGAEFEWRLSTQFDLPISVGPRIDIDSFG